MTLTSHIPPGQLARDTPLGLKPWGFSSVLSLPTSYTNLIAQADGRCHNANYWGVPQILWFHAFIHSAKGAAYFCGSDPLDDEYIKAILTIRMYYGIASDNYVNILGAERLTGKNYGSCQSVYLVKQVHLLIGQFGKDT